MSNIKYEGGIIISKIVDDTLYTRYTKYMLNEVCDYYYLKINITYVVLETVGFHPLMLSHAMVPLKL